MSLSSRIVFLILIFFASILQAEDFAFDLSDYVVKIKSEAAEVGRPSHGSGVVFSYGNEFYVVTAEHILIPPSPQVHPRFSLSTPHTQASLELLSLDWGHGLALLKVKSPHNFTHDKIPTLDHLKQPHVRRLSGESVLTAGFPHGLDSLSLDSVATLKNSRSQNPRQIQVPYFLEIADAETEKGMSGGVVLSSDLEPLGILEARDDSQNTTLAIPMPVVTRWIQQQFQTNFATTYTRFVQYHRGQHQRDIIGTGSFLIEIRNDFPMQRSRNGSQIGYQISHNPNATFTKNSIQHPFFNHIPEAFPITQEEQGIPVEDLSPYQQGMIHQIQRTSSYWKPKDGRRWFVGLGFRQKGIEHIHPGQVTRPYNYFAFFRLLQHPDATFLAEYQVFDRHYYPRGTNVTSDIFYQGRQYSERTLGFFYNWVGHTFGRKERSVGTPWGGIQFYSSRPFDFMNKQLEETITQISQSDIPATFKEKILLTLETILGVFLAEDSEHITSQRIFGSGELYGNRPIHYLSAKEIETAMAQKSCSEVLTNETDPALQKYRDTLGEVFKILNGRQF